METIKPGLFDSSLVIIRPLCLYWRKNAVKIKTRKVIIRENKKKPFFLTDIVSLLTNKIMKGNLV